MNKRPSDSSPTPSVSQPPVDVRRVALPVMLGVLSVVTFLVSSSGTARAPFLLVMSEDLSSTLAAVANLVALSSVTWGIASLGAGALSDRVGRRAILVTALLLLALSLLVMAIAPNYLIAAFAAAWGGLCGGSCSATIYATVADQVPPSQRGRSLGWVMTGQSLSLVLGAPLAALIGTIGGWRGASATHGLVVGLLALAVWLIVPARAPAAASPGRAAGGNQFRQALSAPVVALLSSGIAERVCYAGMAVYLASYLLSSYGIGLGELAVALALIALGNVVGNLVGSQLADRWSDRLLIVAASALGSGALALPLFLWQPGVTVSIILGFCYSFITAVGRPALVASLSLVPATIRGTVLGLNVTAASIGWLAAAAIGGWLITTVGFGSLAWLGAIMGLVGAVLAVLARALAARQLAA